MWNREKVSRLVELVTKEYGKEIIAILLYQIYTYMKKKQDTYFIEKYLH